MGPVAMLLLPHILLLFLASAQATTPNPFHWGGFFELPSWMQDSARENKRDTPLSTQDMKMVLAEIERDLKTEVDRRRREVYQESFPIAPVGKTYQNYSAIKKLF